MAAGIDDITIYIPKLYIDAHDFASARGLDPEKIKGKRASLKIKPNGEFSEITAIDSIEVPERRRGDRTRERDPGPAS